MNPVSRTTARSSSTRGNTPARRSRHERGATLPEYAIGLAAIVIVIIPVARWIEDQSGDRYTEQEARLADADLGVPTPTSPPSTVAPDSTPPPAPALSITGTSCYAGNKRDIVLSWGAVSDASGIDHYQWSATYPPNGTAGANVTTVGATYAGGPANKDVTIQVRAYDGAGNISPWSNAVSRAAGVCA